MADSKPPLDPKYKGEKTYRLTQPHYRLGRLYQPGELITVTDEVPGRTWDLYEPEAEMKAARKAQLDASKPPRASDTAP